MNLHTSLIALALAIQTSGCGSVIEPRSATSQSTPDYRLIVLRDLQAGRGTFLNAERLGRVEISGISLTLHNTLGMVWFTCIRSFPAVGQSTDYAIFIDGGKIVDTRASVATDNCGKQQYSPLVVIPAARGRSAVY